MSLFAFLMFPIKILVGITIIILIIAWISESIDKKKESRKQRPIDQEAIELVNKVLSAYKNAKTDKEYYYAYSLMDDLIDYQRYLGTNDNATRNYIYSKISEVDPVYHGHKYPQGDLLEVMSNATKYN